MHFRPRDHSHLDTKRVQVPQELPYTAQELPMKSLKTVPEAIRLCV